MHKKLNNFLKYKVIYINYDLQSIHTHQMNTNNFKLFMAQKSTWN